VPAGEIAGGGGQSALRGGALVGLDQTFFLHSHPGATRTIHLDCNGASIAGTVWNSSGTTINAASDRTAQVCR